MASAGSSQIPGQVAYRILERFPEKNEKHMSPTSAAAVAAISALITTGGLTFAMRKHVNRPSLKYLLPVLGGSAAAASSIPIASRLSRLQRQGVISREEALNALENMDETSFRGLEKSAAPITFQALKGIGQGLRFGGKTLGMAGKTVFQGLRGGKNVPERAWSMVARTGVAGGLGYGGYKAIKPIVTAPPPRSTYSTMIRNNVLSGRLGPSNLSQQDLIRVRKMGLS